MTQRQKKQIWSRLSNGKRSAISLMWNKFRSVDEVAKRLAIEPEIITAYLASRPGYPGQVLKPKSEKRVRLTLMDMGIPREAPQPRPVSLPRVRILEKSYDWLDGGR